MMFPSRRKCKPVLLASLLFPLLAMSAQAETFTVMTRNLYVGTDVDAVLSASRSELPIAVAQAWATFQSTNYVARMAAIAEEIRQINPHLVGLQEVTLLRSQSPGDSMNLRASTPAETEEADFLATLLAELAVLGLDYRVVAAVQNVDIEVPKANADGSYDDLRLTDFDVILARGDVGTVNATEGTYAAALHFQTATITRGWVAVDATVKGATVRFVSTHLEDVDTVRYAQSVELIRTLARERGPLILVGDFNSKSSDDLAHRAFLATGYTDRWAGPGPGYTCCQAADLTNSTSQLYERDDIIFTRNIVGAAGESTLIGDTPDQFTPGLFWPSDHAGVWAQLEVAP